MFHSYEDLEVWKRSCQLAVNVYDCMRECREYSLRNQMQRAAVSLASNIAEGSERGGKDFKRFLNIAKGSAAELRTQLYIACKIVTLEHERMLPLVDELKQLSRMLTALSKTIATQKTEH